MFAGSCTPCVAKGMPCLKNGQATGQATGHTVPFGHGHEGKGAEAAAATGNVPALENGDAVLTVYRRQTPTGQVEEWSGYRSRIWT